MCLCRGHRSFSDAVDAWYSEVSSYNFDAPGWSSQTGHFTQLVWKSTTKVGCAYTTKCTWSTYVCQYSAPGNVIGTDWSEQVKPQTAGDTTTTTTPGSSTWSTPVVPAVPSQPNADSSSADSSSDDSTGVIPAPRDDSSLFGNNDDRSASSTRDSDAPTEIPVGHNPTDPSQQNPEPLPQGHAADGSATTPPAGMSQPPPGHNPNWPWSVQVTPNGAGG